jgi:hypothetical protein
VQLKLFWTCDLLCDANYRAKQWSGRRYRDSIA